MSMVPQGPSSARRAALTAASTSGSPASETIPISRLSTGDRSSKVLPDFAATNSPLMKFRIFFSAMADPRYPSFAFVRSARFALGLALGDIGQQFGSAIGRRQSPEQKRETDDRLHLFPCRACPSRGNAMQGRRIVHVHQ